MTHDDSLGVWVRSGRFAHPNLWTRVCMGGGAGRRSSLGLEGRSGCVVQPSLLYDDLHGAENCL